jgi:hypothetical protein
LEEDDGPTIQDNDAADGVPEFRNHLGSVDPQVPYLNDGETGINRVRRLRRRSQHYRERRLKERKRGFRNLFTVLNLYNKENDTVYGVLQLRVCRLHIAYAVTNTK